MKASFSEFCKRKLTIEMKEHILYGSHVMNLNEDVIKKFLYCIDCSRYHKKEILNFHESSLNYYENGKLRIGFYLTRPSKNNCEGCKVYVANERFDYHLLRLDHLIYKIEKS